MSSSTRGHNNRAHPTWRESTADIRVEAEASSGEDAYTLYLELKPDVLIIDLSLPGISGIEAIRRIRLRDPTARILTQPAWVSPGSER